MMAIAPATSSAISASSRRARKAGIGRTTRASAGIGTAITPAPRAPSAVTRICQAPVCISQIALS